MAKDDDSKRQHGPKPDRLNIDGDWEEAVRKALEKKKPEEGWPDHDDSSAGEAKDQG